MNLDRTQSARELVDRAAAALDAAQLGEANALIRLAIRQNPDDAVARLLDAKIQIRRNLPEFAIVALDSRDQIDPAGAQDPEVALLRAEALAAAAFDEMALDLLVELVEVIPHDARPHRMLAGIYLKQNKGDRAAEHLRQVQRIDPTDESVRRVLTHVLASTDPRAAVEAAIPQVMHDNDATATLRTARMCRNTDRLRDAADLYTQLLKQQPHDGTLWLEAGELAVELGETDLAIKRFEEAANLGDGHRPAALAQLALVQMHCGRFAAAATLWWKLARLSGGEARPWAGLWLSAWCGGRSTLAKRVRRRLEARSDAAQRCVILAELWPHVSAARAQGALARDGAAGSVLNELAREATATFERTLSDHANRADVHFHRAVCEHVLGDAAAATASLERALAINPNYAAAQHLRGLIDGAAGDEIQSAA